VIIGGRDNPEANNFPESILRLAETIKASIPVMIDATCKFRFLLCIALVNITHVLLEACVVTPGCSVGGKLEH